MIGSQRPYRVVFTETRDDGDIRRGTITVHDLATARREARALARDGKPAEVHHVNHHGQRQHLETYHPDPRT